MEVMKVVFMYIFRNGSYCPISRRCINCKAVKHGSEFYFMSKTCKDCVIENLKIKIDRNELEKTLKKMHEYSWIDLGIEALNPNYYIALFTSDTKFAKNIHYNLACDLYEKGVITVMRENAVYLLFKQNKYLKQKVILDSKYTCYYCGKFGDTVDHIIPKKDGGLWIESNLICCCNKCNVAKAELDIDDFIRLNGNPRAYKNRNKRRLILNK
jgi:hypothetical protein